MKEPTLEVIKKLFEVPVIIDDSILDKIKYLCSEIPEVEWSGVLIYDIEGSIKDVKNFKCIIKEIIPMDKGTAGFTQYDMDERVTNYFEEDLDRFDYRIGHIHSHNTMKTFFSGTDMEELNDNSAHHNYYLSLIVNNFMSMTAKIAYRADVAGFSYVAEDENGDKYEEEISLNKTVMMTYDCDIKVPNNTINVSDDFISKVKGIKSHKKKVVTPYYKPHPNSVKYNQPLNYTDDFFGADDDELFNLDYFDDTIEEFACTLLRLNKTIVGDSIDVAMEDVITSGKYKTMFTNMDTHYDAIFYDYYKGFPEHDSSVGADILGEVIDGIETYVNKYPEFQQLITILKTKYDEYRAK